MDVLPSGSIFHELKVVHDTGYFDGKVSPEERWQQVRDKKGAILISPFGRFQFSKVTDIKKGYI